MLWNIRAAQWQLQQAVEELFDEKIKRPYSRFELAHKCLGNVTKLEEKEPPPKPEGVPFVQELLMTAEACELPLQQAKAHCILAWSMRLKLMSGKLEAKDAEEQISRLLKVIEAHVASAYIVLGRILGREVSPSDQYYPRI